MTTGRLKVKTQREIGGKTYFPKVSEHIYFKNQCFQHLIWVKEVWAIGVYDILKTLGLKDMCAVAKKSKIVR